MTLEMKNIDLLKMDGYVKAHCISADCAMGAGIALQFIDHHERHLRSHCIRHVAFHRSIESSPLGSVCRYDDAHGVLYNIITKEKYWQKARVRDRPKEYKLYKFYLRYALESIKNMMIFHGENKIALPKLGCGLDKCLWKDVKQIIADTFDDTNIEVVICVKP